MLSSLPTSRRHVSKPLHYTVTPFAISSLFPLMGKRAQPPLKFPLNLRGKSNLLWPHLHSHIKALHSLAISCGVACLLQSWRSPLPSIVLSVRYFTRLPIASQREAPAAHFVRYWRMRLSAPRISLSFPSASFHSASPRDPEHHGETHPLALPHFAPSAPTQMRHSTHASVLPEPRRASSS